MIPVCALVLAASLPLTALDRLVAVAPDRPAALAARAVALERAGEPAEALLVWQAVVALRPAEHPPHLHQARLLVALGKVDEALDAVDRAAELGLRMVPAPAPLFAGATTDPVALPVQDGGPPRLVRWLPADVLRARADLLLAAGRWADALEPATRLAAHRCRGRALLALLRYAEAGEAFAAALAVDPADATAHAGQVYARAAQGDPADVPAGDHPHLRAARAHRKYHTDDPAGAAAEALTALVAEPRSHDLLWLAGRALMAADRPTAAAVVLSQLLALALDLSAEARAEVLLGRGEAWLSAGSPAAADRDGARAAELTPAHPAPADLRGRAAEACGDYKAAVGWYAEAVGRDPRHPHAVGRLALLRASAPDPAVRDPESAVLLAGGLPDGPHRDALLAVGHAAAGRYGRAVHAINAALAGGPSADDAAVFTRMRAGFLLDRPWRGGDETE